MTHMTFEGQNGMEWVFVDHSEKLPYVVMTQVIMLPLGDAGAEFDELETDDERFRFSAEIVDAFLGTSEDFRVLLSTAKPDVRGFILGDPDQGGQARIQMTVRRMGADNGMDTLVHVDNNLKKAVRHTLGVSRTE